MLKPKFSKKIAGMAMVFAISATAAISANAGTTQTWSVSKPVNSNLATGYSAYTDKSNSTTQATVSVNSYQTYNTSKVYGYIQKEDLSYVTNQFDITASKTYNPAYVVTASNLVGVKLRVAINIEGGINVNPGYASGDFNPN